MPADAWSSETGLDHLEGLRPDGNAGDFEAAFAVGEPAGDGIAFNADQGAGKGLAGDGVLDDAVNHDAGNVRQRAAGAVRRARRAHWRAGSGWRGILGRLFLGTRGRADGCEGEQGQGGHPPRRRRFAGQERKRKGAACLDSQPGMRKRSTPIVTVRRWEMGIRRWRKIRLTGDSRIQVWIAHHRDNIKSRRWGTAVCDSIACLNRVPGTRGC